MKRSLQEVVELVVFGLIALLLGTGVLWLVGWVFGLVGLLFKVLAGLIWWLLRFIVPVAIVAGLVYFLVRVVQGQGDRRPQPAVTPTQPASPAPVTGAAPAAPTTEQAATAATVAEDAAPRAAPVEDTDAGDTPGDGADAAPDEDDDRTT
jgi:predicted lipid-binding transport protein (Tim44 family)